MHSYCIIPNDQKVFRHLVGQLAVGPAERGQLEMIDVVRVEVDTQKNSWRMMLRGEELLAEQLLNKLADKLCKECGLKAVYFVQQRLETETLLKMEWKRIVDEVAGSAHSVKHLLNNAVWRYEDGCLQVETVGDLSLEILEAQQAIPQLEQRLSDLLGKRCPVRHTALTVAETVVSDDDIMTPEYLEALQGAATETKKEEITVFFGRPIKNAPQPLDQITEEARGVIVSGQLLNLEFRTLRSGRFLLTFDLGDVTGGISGKVFFEDKDKETFDKVAANLKSGMAVKAKGTVQFDKYSNELVLYADSICRLEVIGRKDEAEVKRIELHAHTRMSNMDAVVSAKQLIQTAIKWGHEAIAITDHGVVQAFPEAHDAAAKAGLKVIYGMEGYLFDEEIARARHIIILAKNSVGLRNLYRLVSLSHLKYLYRTPRIPRAILNEYRDGLILGSACEAGELIQAIIRGDSEEQIEAIAAFYDYLEIQPIGNNEFMLRENMLPNEEALREINRKVCRLGEKLGKLVVATGDVHFLNPEDEAYRRILMAGKGFSDADHQPPLYLRTTEEMLQEFSYLGKDKAKEVVIDNPHKVAALIEKIKPIPDELYSPEIPGAEDDIRNMATAKAENMYGTPLPEIVAARLKYELDAIINNGFAVLYLIAHKLVKKSLDDAYLVGSRGSVGSSFVATMTDITEVNPLPPHWRCAGCKHSEFIGDGTYGGGFDLPDKDCPDCGLPMIKDGHDIPFAVFMGFFGEKVPDIDLNFSGEYQATAHKYTEELFGKDNVFKAGTIATIADKTAYGYVKNYFNDKGIMPRNAHVNSLVSGCTGAKRTTGQHPGGIMVVPRDMDVHHFTPIQHPADDKDSGTITTHFDYHSISGRLVKLDILGHDDPTMIRMLEDITGLDAKKFPFDDQATMSLFSSTKALGISPHDLGSPVATFGIPEFGTKFVRQMLEDTLPKTFSELVRISGFSHGTDVWLNNAQDLIKEGTAKLSEAISARDDIMVYLIQKGVEPQVAFKIMESVRKGKGVKPDDVAKMREKDVPEWYVESCQKIKYMFPKAHAVAYVMMAFRIAYCKVHHPKAFYAAYCTVRATEFDADVIVQGKEVLRAKLNEFESMGNTISPKEKGLQTIFEIALEMYLRGFSFRKVDLYESDATKFLIVEEGLLPPLAALQGVGDNAALSIAAAREGHVFSSIEDLRSRSRVSKTVIEVLRQHGCLEGMLETDQMILFG